MILCYAERGEAWLKARKGYISATELSSLMGLNSYQTANKLYADKQIAEVEPLDNPFIWDGLRLEPAAIRSVELLGWQVDTLAPKGHVLMFTDEKMGLSSTPDAFRFDIPSVVEAKSTTQEHFENHWQGQTPPLRYVTQVQAQMHTTTMSKGFLICVVARPNIPVSIYEIEYSPEFMAMADEAIKKFKTDPPTKGKRFKIRENFTEEAVFLLEQSVKHLGTFQWGGDRKGPTDELIFTKLER